MIEKLGFDNKLVSLFLECVTSVRYRITHADDSYIYCQADKETTLKVISMLHVYEKALGQKLNAAKSSVFFSSNMLQEVRNDICDTLQFHEADENTTYLGLPSILGSNKNDVLGYLKDRMQKGIEGYDKKLLYKVGKKYS
ncbi:uncharacterized protein LOC141673666 [Apium graveolens]|uniref:uncharacterized protein LOC141673666 n=1 Tax=Apium graveolens TaxID=4045 RepID=UPI003D7B11A9